MTDFTGVPVRPSSIGAWPNINAAMILEQDRVNLAVVEAIVADEAGNPEPLRAIRDQALRAAAESMGQDLE
jgi:hypothetical protein